MPFFKLACPIGSFPDDDGAAGGPRGEGNGLAGGLREGNESLQRGFAAFQRRLRSNGRLPTRELLEAPFKLEGGLPSWKPGHVTCAAPRLAASHSGAGGVRSATNFFIMLS